MASLLRLLVLALAASVLAGCSVPAAEQQEGEPRFALDTTITLLKDAPLRYMQNFTLASAARVEYGFRIGDGGVVSACFVRGGDADGWLGGKSPPTGVDIISVDTWGCVYATHDDTTGGADLDAGKWTFVLRFADCPARDCLLRVGTDAPSKEVSSLRDD